MNLFNKKTISKHIKLASEPSDKHQKILLDWSELITNKKINNIKETALSSDFKSKIVETILGYTSPVGNDEYTVESEQRILKGSVDLALGYFSNSKTKIIAPFELKGAKTKDLDAIMAGRAKSPVQQAWEYATNNVGTKWVLVSNYLEIRLYGFGEGTQSYEYFDMAKLYEPEEYKRFILLLSSDQLLTGKTQGLLDESRKEDKDITDALYKDYKKLRNSLITSVREVSNIDPLAAISTAQTILDRVLFIAFAEDTGLLPQNILAKAFEHSDPFNPKPIWQNFHGLFRAIDKGNAQLDIPKYNGGLFTADPKIDALELSDETCEAFKEIGNYDFASEISVTVLGHIFEQSIADVENLQAEAKGEALADIKKTGTSGRRKRDGVVYTPDYIARFIVEYTIGTHILEIFTTLAKGHIKKNSNITDYETVKWKNKKSELAFWKAYRDRIKTVRIVDPACGSGVFLIMAFDFMKAEMTRVNHKIADLKDGVSDLFDPDSDILSNNLFGVDVNSESVEITKLSLWIKTARRGKVLDSLDDNIWIGDSLIEDSNYAYLDHAFTWKDAFPDIFAEGGFDIVLGNPPYVRQELLANVKPYLKKRFESYHGVADLYVYFFERGLRLLKDGGRMGYISSSTFFKTSSGKPLKNYLLQEATIENVVDFGDHQIFKGVTTYPAILTIQRGKPSKDHQIDFWSVDEMPKDNFRAAFADHKAPYPQSALSEEAWEFEAPELLALRSKITQGRKTLKQVYGSPYRGVLTGRNEAFVIDGKTRDRLLAEDPKSAERLKSWLEGKDLKRWRAEPRDLSLIFFPKGWTISAFGNGDEITQWTKLQSQYPAICEHLAQYETVCKKRCDKGDYWWELRACDYYKEFEKPKIVYNRFIDKPQFLFDTKQLLINDAPYFIPNADSFLVAYLNSYLAWFYILSVVPSLRGGFVQINAKYIEPTPIPEASDAQKTELAKLAEAAQTHAEARYKLQEALRRRIPDLCPSDRKSKLTNKLKSWWEFADFAAFRTEIKKVFKADIPLADRTDWEDWITRDRAEINRLSAEIKTCEDQINTLVYILFDLTNDEIKLLEANI